MLKVTKDQVRVDIFTQDHIIRGHIHPHKGSRLSDFLNLPKEFLSVTNLEIFHISSGRVLYTADYMILNRGFVMGIVPVDAGAPAPLGQSVPDQGIKGKKTPS